MAPQKRTPRTASLVSRFGFTRVTASVAPIWQQPKRLAKTSAVPVVRLVASVRAAVPVVVAVVHANLKAGRLAPKALRHLPKTENKHAPAISQKISQRAQGPQHGSGYARRQ